MKKRIAFRRLGRTTSHKKALLRNLVTALIKHERIVTTLPKAKELRRLADHMITLAKAEPSNKLSAIRHANAILFEKPVLTKLFEVLGPRYEKREGGYTRVLKLSKRRAGDNAEMALMEYVDRPGEYRAARPPTSVQQEIMAEYIQATIGLKPLTSEEMAEIEKELEGLTVDKK
jgi:large subunit ribosomal protein L17